MKVALARVMEVQAVDFEFLAPRNFAKWRRTANG
jgi:hypothetical protein